MRPVAMYEVVGPHSYRGHEPGTVFPARPGRVADARALLRGTIRLVETIGASLPETFELPEGWAT